MTALDAWSESRPSPGAEHNEDFVLLDVANGVFALADGMGGRAGGEMASRRAVEVFVEATSALDATLPSDAALGKAVTMANRSVRALAAELGFSGMGSTLSAIVLRGPDGKLVHLGDSKVLLYRSGEVTPLSLDFTAEAEFRRLDPDASVDLHPRFQHMLTRAVGIEEVVEPQIDAFRVSPGDRLILASDGLTKALDPDEILTAVLERPEAGARETCQRLFDLAEAREPDDDLTVAVVAVHGEAAS